MASVDTQKSIGNNFLENDAELDEILHFQPPRKNTVNALIQSAIVGKGSTPSLVKKSMITHAPSRIANLGFTSGIVISSRSSPTINLTDSTHTVVSDTIVNPETAIPIVPSVNVELGSATVIVNVTVDNHTSIDTTKVLMVENPTFSDVSNVGKSDPKATVVGGNCANSSEVDIDASDYAEELKLWSNTLMGNVLGGRPTLKTVQEFVNKTWANIASPTVQYFKQGWFTFRFDSDAALNNVLKQGPWKVGHNTLILKQWSPSFSLDMDRVAKVPIWILFPGLDPFLRTDKVLSKMASKVGKPLFADPATTSKEKLSFARVLVEADVSKELPSHVILGESYEAGQVELGGTSEASVVVVGSVERNVDSECSILEGQNGLGGTSDSIQYDGLVEGKNVGSPSSQLGQRSSSHLPLSSDLISEMHQECPSVAIPSPGMIESPDPGCSTSSLGLATSSLGSEQSQMTVLSTAEVDQVKIGNASRILTTSFRHWDSICNYGHHYNGRIWLLYNPINVTLSVQSIGDQWISCSVFHKVSSTSFNLTVVYGSNNAAERNALWAGMQAASTPNPWLVIRDFNVVRCPAEKLGPHPPILNEMMDFDSCLISCNLDDIAGTGADMTWTNKQDPLTIFWSKLDRALVNQQWISSFPTSNALFMESGLSDHSHVVVQLKDCQKKLLQDPFSPLFIEAERDCLANYTTLKKAEFDMLTQRAKLTHIQSSDTSSKYFFAKIAERKHQQYIVNIVDHNGLLHQGVDYVSLAFHNYYTQLLGQTAPVHNLDDNFIGQGPCVSEDNKVRLVQDISSSEIRAALFSIDSNSSPEVDGFSSGLFKSSWDIIKGDFCAAVHSFFRSGHMAKQANSTLISLIPKKAIATSVLDYRLISCCTVFYKTVSKILSNRIQPILPYLIREEQAAFVKGRNIFENIMLSQSLIKGYARKILSQRCLIKVDIKKAFDSIQWEFLSQMLSSLGFPSIFSNWIMGCITNTWYSFKLNGGIAGFFPGKSGIRQGDPLSPYLFVLSMEILSRYLRVLCAKKNVSYHPKCSKLNLNHLIFADDLMIFVRGDVPSVVAVKNTLVEYALLYGLHANVDKTNIYLGGVSPELVSEILQETGFSKGQFPFKYLGIP
ncbi:uncharacterized protein LOC141637696 [Silene latifolia]|uniref:uncharacterized protein LOC141637696 n=1 Tax=Silene latifolia TaxID=37657 RepID=UPI003D775562